MYYNTLLLYTLAIIFLLSLLFATAKRDGRNNAIFLILSFVILFFVHAFKDFNTFPDLPAYVYGFFEAAMSSWNSLYVDGIMTFKCETGFGLFMKVVSLFSRDSVFFLAVVSFLTISGYFFVIKNYSNTVWLSVLFFLLGPYCRSLFVIRQHLAVAICIFSFYFILKRKLIPFLLLVVLAFSFHKTALIFTPLYFLYGINSGKKMWYLFITGLIVLLISFRMIVLIMAEEVGGYSSYIEETTEVHFNYILLSVSLLTVRIIVMKGKFFKGEVDKLLSIVLCLVTLLSIVGASFESTGRMLLYYSGLSCLYFPNTLEKIKDQPTRWTVTGAYLLLLSFLYISGLDYFNTSMTIW